MSEAHIRPVLAGQKALVVGAANDQSIAYGCAKAFRTVGAELAITRLNERARAYVEPLAQELQAGITGGLDVSVPGQLEAAVRAHCPRIGLAGHPGALDRFRAKGGPAGRAAERGLWPSARIA
jgi:enoyl-[acyl-carrier protein] reductase I